MAGWFILAYLWRRDDELDDSDYLLLLLLPALVVVGMPWLVYVGVRKLEGSPLAAFSWTTVALAAVAIAYLLVGLWWTVAVAAAIGLAGTVATEIGVRRANKDDEEQYIS